MPGSGDKPASLNGLGVPLDRIDDISLFHSPQPVDYRSALSAMESRVAAIAAGEAREAIWFLEHWPVLTLGASTRAGELPGTSALPVVKTNRGGRVTYHGPGQRVIYVMLHLERFAGDIRLFVNHLEQWVIDSLAVFAITAFRSDAGTGVWVHRPENRIGKIGAVGVRIRKRISFHGICVNICPDLQPYRHFVPCGLRPEDYDVTSMAQLDQHAVFSVHSLDQILVAEIRRSLSARPERRPQTRLRGS